MDDDACFLGRLGPALRGDGVALVVMQVDVAVLQDDSGVAEDEVDCAVDIAVAVELISGVDVEGVLVPFKAALIEHGMLGIRTQSHGLPVLRPRRVLECDATADEPGSLNSCDLLVKLITNVLLVYIFKVLQYVF